MSIKDFINGKVTYDKFGGQYFWIAQPGGGSQMLAELRGWGHIQNMFAKKDGIIDASAAEKYQDEIGDFIAEAINEKMERNQQADVISPCSTTHEIEEGKNVCKNCGTPYLHSPV